MMTDITLFNRYVGAGRLPTYHRTYLYKVDWTLPRWNLGSPPSYNTLIKIPYAESLYYLEKRTWQSLAEKGLHWTLQLEDIIVKGIVDADLESVTDNLYNLYSLTDMRKTFETVTIVDIQLSDISISQQSFDIGVK